MKEVKIYGNFERYWHWAQMGAIFTLLITGFEIHSSYELMGYELAVNVHNIAGWGYSILLVFTFFWMIISGIYKQFLPTREKLIEQLKFYAIGIMHKAPHPIHKTPENKLNPIQRITYFGLVWFMLPAQVITGFLYMYVKSAKQFLNIESVEYVALIHTLLAFMVITFLIIHVYMITTGNTVTAYLKGMITGKEEIEVQS